MMKFKLCAFADEADVSIDGQIRALTENGITRLEIRGVDGQNISEISTEKAKSVRQKLDASGISVWSIGSPYGKIGIADDFSPHLDRFRRGLELAGLLGATRMRVFSFYLPRGRAEEYSDAVTERLDAFCTAAKGSGILLCHENEKGIFGDTPARCLAIHKALPQIKAVFDPANFIQCGQDTKTAWDVLAPYVEYMHVKDALADGRVVPAGKGIGDLPGLLARYGGEVLTLEPHLSAFVGLAELESSDKTAIDGGRYPDKRAAFDTAAAALKNVIAACGAAF